MKISISFLLLLLVIGCHSKKHDSKQSRMTDSTAAVSLEVPVTADTTPVELIPTDTAHWRPLKSLEAYGDFDGDGVVDTLISGVIDSVSRAVLDSEPNPHVVEWDTVVNYFSIHSALVTVSFKGKSIDTLFCGPSGSARGLYYLFPIGDISGDGREDVALVVDYCDYSQTNDCFIYSYSSEGWQQTKVFGVNENSFSWSRGKEMPHFTEISNSLLLRNGRWVYCDYMVWMTADSPDTVWHYLDDNSYAPYISGE